MASGTSPVCEHRRRCGTRQHFHCGGWGGCWAQQQVVSRGPGRRAKGDMEDLGVGVASSGDPGAASWHWTPSSKLTDTLSRA